MSTRPVTSADKKLAKKHLKATIKFNKTKVKDHLKAAKKSGYDREYNLSHAKGHQEDIKRDRKRLTSGSYLSRH